MHSLPNCLSSGAHTQRKPAALVQDVCIWVNVRCSTIVHRNLTLGWFYCFYVVKMQRLQVNFLDLFGPFCGICNLKLLTKFDTLLWLVAGCNFINPKIPQNPNITIYLVGKYSMETQIIYLTSLPDGKKNSWDNNYLLTTWNGNSTIVASICFILELLEMKELTDESTSKLHPH